MKPDVWMAWYIADYMKDTRHLTCLQHGAYRQMIDHVYLAGGRLTVTDEEIVRMLSISVPEWEMIRDKIRSFFNVAGDTWSHKRVSRELRKARNNKALQRKRTEKARHVLQQKLKSVTDPVTKTVTTSPSPSPSPSPVLAERESHFPECNGYPTETEVIAKGAIIGLAEWKCRDWWNEMQGCGWLDHAQRPIKDWQAVMVRVKVKWEADGRPSGPPKARHKPNKDFDDKGEKKHIGWNAI